MTITQLKKGLTLKGFTISKADDAQLLLDCASVHCRDCYFHNDCSDCTIDNGRDILTPRQITWLQKNYPELLI